MLTVTLAPRLRLLLASACLLGLAAVQAQDFANSCALVIGADTYGSLGMQWLSNIESDELGEARNFGAQHYEVTQRIDPPPASE